MAVEQSVTKELSLSLPRALDTRIFIRITTQAKAISIFITTATADEGSAPKPMGSFIYALPDRFNAQQPLATTLFSHEPTVEFSTRLARLIAKKSGMPTYVANSMSLENAGMGGTVEEEMEAFKGIVGAVMGVLKEVGLGPAAVNGT